MATYTLLVPAGSRPGQIDALEKAIPVKNGFRVWALAFPFLFTLYHRLWRPFFALVAVMAVLGVLASRDVIGEGTVLLLDLLVGVYAGSAAADWMVTARERKNFVALGAVSADDEDEALLRFAHHWMEGQVSPPISSSNAAPVRAPQAPVIGLFPESGGR